jgi:hypothetical protein
MFFLDDGSPTFDDEHLDARWPCRAGRGNIQDLLLWPKELERFILSGDYEVWHFENVAEHESSIFRHALSHQAKSLQTIEIGISEFRHKFDFSEFDVLQSLRLHSSTLDGNTAEDLLASNLKTLIIDFGCKREEGLVSPPAWTMFGPTHEALIRALASTAHARELPLRTICVWNLIMDEYWVSHQWLLWMNGQETKVFDADYTYL